MAEKIKIGTRKSALALVQTHIIIEELKKIDDTLEFEIVPISTKGDEILDKPLAKFGGKGVFVDAFEDALLRGDIDIAVHSAKDMPMDIPKGLSIVGVPKREAPTDVLISRKDLDFNNSFTVGTSSLRRQLQIEAMYNAKCVNLRGNVPTRINHLREGGFDAIILATAGINRLGLNNIDDLKYTYFSETEFIPSAGQGILAVEGREKDPIADIIRKIDHRETRISLELERSILKKLNSGCHEAVGAYSFIENEYIFVRAIYEVNGKLKKVYHSGNINDIDNIANFVVKRLNDE